MAFNALVWSAFWLWIPLRARSVARKWDKDREWQRRIVRQAREWMTDPSDFAAFEIETERGPFEAGHGTPQRIAHCLSGQSSAAGQIAPQSGRSAIRLQSNDAGGVIRSAGLLTQGRGGQFDMTLTPTGDPGQFDGAEYDHQCAWVRRDRRARALHDHDDHRT